MKLVKLIFLSTILVLSGCVSSNIYPEKAIVEPKLIISSIELEKQINARKSVPLPAGEQWYKVIDGHVPIIITAPHATSPFRLGKRRFSDGGGTAALAVALAELTDATVIYSVYEGPSDPNYYDDNAFKKELARLIHDKNPMLVLDIHGSHPFRSYDIDLGTMDGKSLLGNDDLLYELIQNLKSEGIFSISNNRFGASKNQTITRFSSHKGIPAIQLEINATYVTPTNGNIEAQRFSRLVQALTRYIKQLLGKNH